MLRLRSEETLKKTCNQLKTENKSSVCMSAQVFSNLFMNSVFLSSVCSFTICLHSSVAFFCFILKGSFSGPLQERSSLSFRSDPALHSCQVHASSAQLQSLLWICLLPFQTVICCYHEGFRADDAVDRCVEDLIWFQVCSVNKEVRRCGVCVKMKQFDIRGLLFQSVVFMWRGICCHSPFDM